MLGATAALASAAFALPALAQGADDTPGAAQPDWAGSADPAVRHAEMLEELEGLDGDAVAQRLEELYAERAEVHAERYDEREAFRTARQADRQTERATRYAEREALGAERHAEVMTQLEGLEGQELTDKLEELRAERQTERAERQAERGAIRGERQAAGAGRGSAPRMGMDEECPLASE